MLLFMIRHGETEGNVKKLFYSQIDMPLTEKGKQQALAIRPLLEKYTFDRVYASDLSRALETAKLILPGCEPIPVPQLRECEMGWIDGRTHWEIINKYGLLNDHYEQFGGESPEDMCRRFREFLTMVESDPCDMVAAVAHSGTMKAMIRVALGMECQVSNLLSTNCNIAVFRYENGRWLLAAWNLAGNIEGEPT
jgi:broad specificity phosphatase PhoE